MRRLTHRVAGEECRIFVIEPGDDKHYDTIEREIARWPIVGMDTEGTGTDPYVQEWRLRLVQFGNDRVSFVLRGDAHEHLIRRAIDRVIGSDQIMVAHNADYDMLSLRRAFGYSLHDLFASTLDTLTVSRILDPTGYSQFKGADKLAPTHALKDRIRQLVDGSFDMDRALKEEFRRLKLKVSDGYARVPIENDVYLRYAGLDPILAYRFLESLRHFNSPERFALIEYERRVSYMLACMRDRGLRLDREFTEQARATTLAEAKILGDQARAEGWPVADTAKKIEKIKLGLYFAEHGLEMPRTKTDGLSTSKPALLAALRDSEIEGTAKKFFEAKELVRFERDYLQKFLKAAEYDGRLHPEFDGMGAQTGRMSVSKPPLQQLPPIVRSCLVADEGRVLITADQKQVEMRVGAALTGDANLRSLVLSGQDIHDMIAGQLYGNPFTDHQRNLAKKAGLGRMYGGGKFALATQTGVPEEVAAEVIQRFDEKFPGVKRYARELSMLPEVVTYFGRHVAIDPERSYGGINYKIQGTARDTMVHGALRCHDAGLGEFFWLFVHDEIDLNVPKEDAKEVAHLVKKLMTMEMEGIPLDVDVKIIGDRWIKE